MDGYVSETARLHFQDALGRPVAVYCQRQYPVRNASGVGMLHCVGGSQTIHPADLEFWNAEGHASASFDWQLGPVAEHSVDAATRFPDGVVAQHATTEKLENAVMPVTILCGRVVLDWLSQAPGVNPQKLGVCGISWGGYLSWLLAAYDARVRLIVPVFGCGGTFAEGRDSAVHGPSVRQAWKAYWEPQKLAVRVQIPVC